MKASEFTDDLIGKEIKFFEDGIVDFMTMKLKRCESRGKIFKIERSENWIEVRIHKYGNIYAIIGENFKNGYNTIYDAELI